MSSLIAVELRKVMLIGVEFCSVLWDSLHRREAWERMDTCICMTESLRCSLETITTLLIVSVLSLVTQSCLTLCNPLDFSPPSSSVHGDSPGKNTGVGCHALHPGDLPNPGIEPRSPALQADSLPAEPQEKPKNTGVGSLSLFQHIFPTQELYQSLLHCRQIL